MMLREENHQHHHEADEHRAVGNGKLEHLEGDRSVKGNLSLLGLLLRIHYLKNWIYLPNMGSLPIMTSSSSQVRKVAMLAT